MEIKYQSGLPHQQRAIDAIVKVFENTEFEKPAQHYENPKIDFSDLGIANNIRTIQKDKQYNVADCAEASTLMPVCAPTLNLDVKMETGTGKTYVYTHTIYELHKRFGINKFIIAVPTLAIKEGAKSFISDSDVKRHFCNSLGYNAEIDLCVVNAASSKKKNRPSFPTEVSNYVRGSYLITNRIYVLLINMALLSDRENGLLSRQYDNAPEGFYQPYEALRATRPFLIIDEPHRFSRDQKAYKIITEKIEPQCVIRFGATFPDITEGRGKNKITKKDYQNLLYNLNSCQAFNQNLIKGVAKEHYNNPSQKAEKIKILKINSKESVVFNHITVNGSKSYTLKQNDTLAMISPDMEGLTIQNVGKNFVEFSNGNQKLVGEEFDVTVCSQSYQEAMIDLALKRHFETERKNFFRSQRIKTLALFFIDDIQSFRGDDNGENAWLRDTFENLLKNHLNAELQNEGNSPEYIDYLNYSLQNIRQCSAGYFAQDNSDSDEAVAQEVDDILRNKKDLLVFKTKEGKWNVRRFLFSKWTLKEGWDNPNVFTITKLRSSGSETSKIQEVGRGLRLPVDEYGNRISNDEFTLNYIVDFKEADFADRLVAEINGELSQKNESKISPDKLDEVAQNRNIEKKKLLIELLSKDYIDTDFKINPENITDFYNDYPEFKPADGVKSGKIINRNKQKTPGISIRAEKYAELKELWQKLNRHYVIFFEKELDKKVETDFHLEQSVFSYVVLKSERKTLSVTESGAAIASESGVEYGLTGKIIPYNDFLKRINKATSLPIKLIHSKIAEYFASHNYQPGYINESTVANIVNYFNSWKIENILGLLKYKQAGYTSAETALTDDRGNLKPEIPQGWIGVTLDSNGTPSKKYLYDKLAYDSEIERNNILSDIKDVVVFGKIPKYSIAIPTVLGNYSPDFMYVVNRGDGKKELNIVIESKGVDMKSTLRGEEKIRIKCAEKFFEQLQLDGIDVKFRTQINNEQMTKIVAELVE